MDLFLISRADIFAIYPKILREILQSEEKSRTKDGFRPNELIRLPSDAEFQDKVYYRLLAVQKHINELVESGITLAEIALKKEKHIWDPDVFSFSNKSSPLSECLKIRRRCVIDDPLHFLNTDFLNMWKLDDLVQAAKLLRRPVIPTEFTNEHEMRRVYSMIYDVYRFKHVINQALENVMFFKSSENLRQDESRIWLLVYDLHLRNFSNREPIDGARQPALYIEADISHLHERIWKCKISLAAALSRLRIQSGALSLSNLLPKHLQDDKVAVSAAVSMVTGWINPFKLSTKAEAEKCLVLNGFLEARDIESGETSLERYHYKWDKVCPMFVSCVPEDRGQFSKTSLVRDEQFIMQDRTFSIGPAVFSRLFSYFDIEGDVVQTQVSSPRSTAYLAALVLHNPRVHAFLAFGAGSRLPEYRSYFSLIGCNNVRIFAENFCKYSVDSNIFEKVIGIFVTPPSSYSGVTDPIDLICSRGGDLTMLEVLTESEMSDNSKQRVAQILQHQRESLRLSLSRPQVQFVLYETHSVVETENDEMVRRTIECVNRNAHARHIKKYRDKRRLEMLAEIEGVSVDQLDKLQGGSIAAKKKLKEWEESSRKQVRIESASSSDGSEESENETLETSRSRMSKRSNNTSNGEYDHIKIPKTDLFESIEVPDICAYQDQCAKRRNTGCYLALVKRKHVTRLDEKHLIVMAERRGLFGDTSPKKAKAKTPPKNARIEKEKTPQKVVRSFKTTDISDLINRIATPTYASRRRGDVRYKSATQDSFMRYNMYLCSRICFHQSFTAPTAYSIQSQYRLWWQQTIEHIRSQVKFHSEHSKKSTSTSLKLSPSSRRRQHKSYIYRNTYPLLARDIVFLK